MVKVGCLGPGRHVNAHERWLFKQGVPRYGEALQNLDVLPAVSVIVVARSRG